jgi:hypothetical protein
VIEENSIGTAVADGGEALAEIVHGNEAGAGENLLQGDGEGRGGGMDDGAAGGIGK